MVTDAVEILDRLFFAGKPHRQAALAKARRAADIAQVVYDLRRERKLTQRGFARLTGLKRNAIRALEAADYHGNPEKALAQIQRAVNEQIIAALEAE